MRKLFGGVPAMLLTVLLAMTVWQGCDLVYNAGRLSILTEKLHFLEQPVEAQGQSPTELQGEVIGFETITVGAAATRFSTTLSANARAAFCTVETVSIRYRMDGTDPTSTVGHLQLSAATSNVAYWFAVVNRNKVISTRMISTGANATVSCSYLR